MTLNHPTNNDVNWVGGRGGGEPLTKKEGSGIFDVGLIPNVHYDTIMPISFFNSFF